MICDHEAIPLKKVTNVLGGYNLIMSTKFLSVILTCICLLTINAVVNAQEPAVQPKPVAYTTAPKLVVAKLKSGDQDAYEVRGKVTFTVTAANSDDTVAGVFNYAIPDDARQKIASMSGKPMTSVPANFTRKDVIASFQKGTAAPVIHLEINPMDVDVAGVKMAFTRVVLDINGREPGTVAKYSKEEMEVLFTVWARQINGGRARRGIISRVNRVINGEADPQ